MHIDTSVALQSLLFVSIIVSPAFASCAGMSLSNWFLWPWNRRYLRNAIIEGLITLALTATALVCSHFLFNR